MKKQARPTLLYIASFPYSGSTIFSIALGNSPGFLNIGEANFIENDWQDERRCYCRKTLATCPFWRQVKEATNTSPDSVKPSLHLDNHSVLRFLDSRKLPLGKRALIHLGVPLRFIFREGDLKDYACRATSFVESLSSIFDAHIIVDASKNPRRLEAFRLYANLGIKVIVLKREPQALLASRLKRARKRNPMYFPLVAPFYLFWLFYHRMSINRLTRKMREEDYLEVSYEEFCETPRALEGRLRDWLGTPVNFAISGENVIDTSNSHIFTGNVRITKHDERDKGILLRETPSSLQNFGALERMVLMLSERIKF